MQAKLYIGSIPGNITEPELRAHFSSICKVISLLLVKNKNNHKTNSGFGFLTVGSVADVQKLQTMDHYLGGRKIKVQPFAEGIQLKKMRLSLMRKRIYISDVPEQVTDAHIEEFFGKFGPLESAYKVKVQSVKKSRTFGYVTFTTEEPALELIKAGSVVIKGFLILVFPYRKGTDQHDQDLGQEGSPSQASAQSLSKSKISHLVSENIALHGGYYAKQNMVPKISRVDDLSSQEMSNPAEHPIYSNIQAKKFVKKPPYNDEIKQSQYLLSVSKDGHEISTQKRSSRKGNEVSTAQDYYSGISKPMISGNSPRGTKKLVNGICSSNNINGGPTATSSHKLVPLSRHQHKHFVIVPSDSKAASCYANTAGISPQWRFGAATCVDPTMKTYRKRNYPYLDHSDQNLQIRLSTRIWSPTKAASTVGNLPNRELAGGLHVSRQSPL